MPKRILISGYEIGGQMQLLAETLRKRCIPVTAAAYNEDYRGYQNDIMLNGKGFKSSINRFFFFIWSLFHYDVFHFFWGISLLSFWRFHHLDLPILKLFGKKIVVHFRGLDVVDIKYFDYKRAISRGEYFKKPMISRPDQIKKIKLWNRYADYILVSEPDLHFVSHKSLLSPQVVDLNYWHSVSNPLSEKDEIIRFVHAPSSRRKKGTDFIESIFEELIKEGYNIELILAENLPHYKILELYSKADVGIDQVLYGWHGKVSVELMALGKPVICNIDESLRIHRPDLPIIHADPSNLKKVILDLVLDVNLRKNIGILGFNYVRMYHDVEIVVDQLLQLYGFDEKTYKTEFVTNAKQW